MAQVDAIGLIKKYFPEDQWDNAIKVMQGESGGNPKAVGDQYPIKGEIRPSYGLFQIRTFPGRPSSRALLDPETNVKFAAKMWKEQGWNPWTAARKLGIVGRNIAQSIGKALSKTFQSSKIPDFQEGQTKIYSERQASNYPGIEQMKQWREEAERKYAELKNREMANTAINQPGYIRSQSPPATIDIGAILRKILPQQELISPLPKQTSQNPAERVLAEGNQVENYTPFQSGTPMPTPRFISKVVNPISRYFQSNI